METTLRVERRPPAFWVSTGLKATLCGVVLLPAIHPEWQQYSGKGMWWRVVVFPLAGLVIPVAWWIAGSRPPYPYLADGLIVMNSSDHLVAAYEDTLGDLGLSLVGSSFAALLSVRQPRSKLSTAPGDAGAAVAFAEP